MNLRPNLLFFTVLDSSHHIRSVNHINDTKEVFKILLWKIQLVCWSCVCSVFHRSFKTLEVIMSESFGVEWGNLNDSFGLPPRFSSTDQAPNTVNNPLVDEVIAVLPGISEVSIVAAPPSDAKIFHAGFLQIRGNFKSEWELLW